MRSFGFPRRLRGHSLVEVSIAAGVLVVLLGLAIPVFKSVGDAGEEGSSRLTAQTENQKALLALASELQNGSTVETNEFGIPRLQITEGNDAAPLIDGRTGEMGGFKGTLGAHQWGGQLPDQTGVDDNRTPDATSTNSHEGGAMGAAQTGGSHWGRERSTQVKGSKSYGVAAVRPRYSTIAKNSVLTFQKISGYTVGPDGSPELAWGNPIVFRIVGDKLVRTQDLQDKVVASYVSGFRAQISDTGTVLLTLVTQKRTSTTGRIEYQANQVEVSPKN